MCAISKEKDHGTEFPTFDYYKKWRRYITVFRVEGVFEKTVKNTFNLQKISIKYCFNLIHKLKEPMTNQEWTRIVNPLTPTSDQDKISPYNINTLSTK